VSATRAKVLLIDDEPDMLRMLAFVLSLEGVDITTVRSGDEAVASFRAESFDVAVTDLKMPGMNGFDTLRALKSIDPSIQIIVATGYATKETAGQCRAHGAYGLIRKPFDVNELKALVERALHDRPRPSP
jgi:DNA-binding NtrC family response regulator